MASVPVGLGHKSGVPAWPSLLVSDASLAKLDCTPTIDFAVLISTHSVCFGFSYEFALCSVNYVEKKFLGPFMSDKDTQINSYTSKIWHVIPSRYSSNKVWLEQTQKSSDKVC